MSKQSRPIRILLVEHNSTDEKLITAQLSRSGLEVLLSIAENLYDAKLLADQSQCDVILLDLELPDSQGLATLQQLLDAVKDVPIIVLTGEVDAQLGPQAVSKGAQDYLPKSKIDPDLLVRSIRYAIALVARQNAEREMVATGIIQSRLFPPAAPQIPNFDVNGRCTPAGYAAGDFFDVFPMGPQHVAVVIADAAGQGMAPALTMSETRAVIRAFASVTSDVGDILTRANAILVTDLSLQRFVSIFLARVDTEASTLRFASAGHTGYVFSAEGRTKQILRSEDPPLGIQAEARYESSNDITLTQGESLVLFTDGLCETVNVVREAFGTQRVFEAIRERYSDGARAIIDALFEQVEHFRQRLPRDDDVTAFIMKANSTVIFEPEAFPAVTKETSAADATKYERLQATVSDDVAVIRLRDEEILTSRACLELRAELLHYIGLKQPPKVVINFENVQRFSSEGVNVCTQVKSILDARHARLRLCGLRGQLRQMLKSLNLDGTVFEVHNDVPSALNSF